MSERAEDTPQYNQSQPAKPGAAQPPSTAGNIAPNEVNCTDVPAPSTEPFLVINVCPGATREQIVVAVDEALKTIDNPFFRYPAKETDAHKYMQRSDPAKMPPCTALMMLVRQEGW